MAMDKGGHYDEVIKRTRFESDSDQVDTEDGECPESPPLREGQFIPPVLMNSDVMKGNETDYGDFVLDRTESLDHNSDISVISAGYIEATGSKWLKRTYSSLLNVNEADENGNAKVKGSSKQSRISCFNCDGQHNMNVCPEPKNMKRIREKKTELREKRQRLDNARYHDTSSSNQKFQPGRLSQSLRHALGIGPDDIPEWIYRMRKMGFIEGYPPGYLKKAIKREDSIGILTFHTVDGSEGSNNDETNNECRSDSPPPVIESDKMIYYLGFNQMYKNLRDLENFKVPPFQEFVAYHQEVLIEKYNDRQATKRRQREKNGKLLKRRQEEMEMDGDILILEPPKPPVLNDGCNDGSVFPGNAINLNSSLDATTSVTPCTPKSSTPRGSSIKVMMGTPVITRRTANSSIVEEEIPSLENFSKGIVPFTAKEEPTPHKGFLKKVIGKIKQFAS